MSHVMTHQFFAPWFIKSATILNLNFSKKMFQPLLSLGCRWKIKFTKLSRVSYWGEAICQFVATLALGSRPKQGLTKVRAKCEARESHFMLPRVQESVREWTLTLLNELPLWELESQWTPKFLENGCRGQNPLDWGVPYIIGKLLELTCLKWARMTHLDT